MVNPISLENSEDRKWIESISQDNKILYILLEQGFLLHSQIMEQYNRLPGKLIRSSRTFYKMYDRLQKSGLIFREKEKTSRNRYFGYSITQNGIEELYFQKRYYLKQLSNSQLHTSLKNMLLNKADFKDLLKNSPSFLSLNPNSTYSSYNHSDSSQNPDLDIQKNRDPKLELVLQKFIDTAQNLISKMDSGPSSQPNFDSVDPVDNYYPLEDPNIDGFIIDQSLGSTENLNPHLEEDPSNLKSEETKNNLPDPIEPPQNPFHNFSVSEILQQIKNDSTLMQNSALWDEITSKINLQSISQQEYLELISFILHLTPSSIQQHLFDRFDINVAILMNYLPYIKNIESEFLFTLEIVIQKLIEDKSINWNDLILYENEQITKEAFIHFSLYKFYLLGMYREALDIITQMKVVRSITLKAVQIHLLILLNQKEYDQLLLLLNEYEILTKNRSEPLVFLAFRTYYESRQLEKINANHNFPNNWQLITNLERNSWETIAKLQKSSPSEKDFIPINEILLQLSPYYREHFDSDIINFYRIHAQTNRELLFFVPHLAKCLKMLGSKQQALALCQIFWENIQSLDIYLTLIEEVIRLLIDWDDENKQTWIAEMQALKQHLQEINL